MQLPILERLKDGEKFDFDTLAENVEQTDLFWEWWWDEKYKEGTISRPDIILESDAILIPTDEKLTVDLAYRQEFFDKTLFRLVKKGILPCEEAVRRERYHQLITQIVNNSSIALSGRPQIVFAGGGYGSGKTTV